jgi:hypothetical protein
MIMMCLKKLFLHMAVSRGILQQSPLPVNIKKMSGVMAAAGHGLNFSGKHGK